MYHSLMIVAIASAALATLFFSTLTFALRDFSRIALQQWLKRRGRPEDYQHVLDAAESYAFITALLRLVCNIMVLICVLAMFHDTQWGHWMQYLYAFLITGAISAIASIAIPLAIARHVGEMTIAFCVPILRILHVILYPAVALMNVIDRLVGHAAGPQTEEQEQQAVEEQILTAVEDGEKEGIVDEQEREMIESVIEFRNVRVNEVMIARRDIVAMDCEMGLTMVREVFERTGNSRIPVYEGTLDQIIGVLYARDLLQLVGEAAGAFDMRKAIRPAFFVPETKPLRELLRDFRTLKVHMAIVLDEYGGTAGLVTIEDVLEQLVGEISDEHEPQEVAKLRKIDEKTWEVDARMTLEDLNEVLPVNLPEDGEIQTLGGYVSTSIGRIPETGATVDLPGVRFTVIDAEPQRINRLRVELLATTP